MKNLLKLQAACRAYVSKDDGFSDGEMLCEVIRDFAENNDDEELLEFAKRMLVPSS